MMDGGLVGSSDWELSPNRTPLPRVQVKVPTLQKNDFFFLYQEDFVVVVDVVF